MGLQQWRVTLCLFGHCIVLLPAVLSLQAPDLSPVDVNTWCSTDWCSWQNLSPHSSCLDGTAERNTQWWKVDAYASYFTAAAQHVADVLSYKFEELVQCIGDNTFYYPDTPADGYSLQIKSCKDITPSVWRFDEIKGKQNSQKAWGDLSALAAGQQDDGTWPDILYGFTCASTGAIGWAPFARRVFTVPGKDKWGQDVLYLDKFQTPLIAIDSAMWYENVKQGEEFFVPLYAANLFHEFLHNMGHPHYCSPCPEFVTVAGECMRFKGDSAAVASERRQKMPTWSYGNGRDCTV